MIDDEIREVSERIANKLFEDVVEVVRCKDCMYSREAMPMVKGQYECGYVLGVRTADDFCSRGERKDKVEK